MKRLLYPFVSLMAATFALIHDFLLEPLARTGDRFLTFGLNFLDDMLPFAAVAGVPDVHALRPTREVTYLTRGLHRLAQPISMRQGDPDEDEDGDDEIDNGLMGGATGTRLNC